MFKPIDYSNFNSLEDFNKYLVENNLIQPQSNVITETAVEDKLDKNSKSIKRNFLDKREVVYAEQIKEYFNIFKHIILLTNSRDPKENKTLATILEAVKNLKSDKNKITPKLHIFVADEIEFDEDTNHLIIKDSKDEYTIQDESNIDTLVITRLGVLGEDNCEHIIQILQDRGFLVLNPVRLAKLASNKYETAVLLDKAGLPQPNFCLMTKDNLYDEKSLKTNLKSIYKDWGEDEEKDKEKEFVVKILDGHGGTGVMLLNGKNMKAVLQTIFVIDPEISLIIQKKEEADGGDIRVHVLTLRNKQVILAAMKRIKLSGGDFRSNISLGATAEKVKLTPEQEQIALAAAEVSKLPWCAVDIMPLVKGSNKEIGDNVILELNASPGTDGISDVVDENFINILLNELDNPNEFFIQEKTAGYIETVDLVMKEGEDKITMTAKLDTGNGSDASTIEVSKLEVNGKKVKATILDKVYEYDLVRISTPIVGTEKHERHVVIIPEIRVGLRKLINVEVALVDNRNKSTNVLLNRDVISRLGYVINCNDKFILTPENDKLKIK